MTDFIVQKRPRHPEAVYHGVRDPRGAIVYRNGTPFDPRPSLLVHRHSPSGFEWGYGGSGPAQLALAIMLDQYELIDARELYQDFKDRVIAKLDAWADWKLTGCDVHEAVCRIIDGLIQDARDRQLPRGMEVFA